MYSTTKIMTSRGMDKKSEKVLSPRPLLKTSIGRIKMREEDKQDTRAFKIFEIKEELNCSIQEIRNMIQKITSNNESLKSEIEKAIASSNNANFKFRNHLKGRVQSLKNMEENNINFDSTISKNLPIGFDITFKGLEEINNILININKKIIQNDKDLFITNQKSNNIKNLCDNIFDFALKVRKQLENKPDSNYSEMKILTLDNEMKSELENSECKIFKQRAKDLQEENNKLLEEIRSLHLKFLSSGKSRKSDSPEITGKKSVRKNSPSSLESQGKVILGKKFSRDKRSGSSQKETKNTDSAKSKILSKRTSSDKRKNDNTQLQTSRVLENSLNSHEQGLKSIDINKNLKALIKKVIGNYSTTLEQLYDQIQNVKKFLKDNSNNSIDYFNSLIEDSKQELNTISKKYYGLCRIEERQLNENTFINKEKNQLINMNCKDNNYSIINADSKIPRMIQHITRNQDKKSGQLEHVTEEKIDKEIPFQKKFSVPTNIQTQANETSKVNMPKFILNSFRENKKNLQVNGPKLPIHLSDSCKLSEIMIDDKPLSIKEKITTNESQISKMHINDIKNNVSKLTILITQREKEIEKLKKRNFDLFNKLNQNEKLKIDLFKKYDDLKKLIYNNFQSYDTIIKIRDEKVTSLYDIIDRYRMKFETSKLKPDRSNSQEPIKNHKKMANIQSEKNFMQLQINSLKTKIRSLEKEKSESFSRLPQKKINVLRVITFSQINQNYSIIKNNEKEQKCIMITKSKINKANPKVNKLVNQNQKLKITYDDLNKKLNDKDEYIKNLSIKIKETEQSEKKFILKCNVLESKLKELEKIRVSSNNSQEIQYSNASTQYLNFTNFKLNKSTFVSKLSFECCANLKKIFDQKDINYLNKGSDSNTNAIPVIQIPFINIDQKKYNFISCIEEIDLKPRVTLQEIKEKLKLAEIQNKDKSKEILELQDKNKILMQEYLKTSEYCKDLAKTYNENLMQKESQIKHSQIQISQKESLHEKLDLELSKFREENINIKTNLTELTHYNENLEVLINENNKNLEELFSIIELGESNFENSKNIKFIKLENYILLNKFNFSNENFKQVLQIFQDNQQKHLILVLGFIEYFYKFRVLLLKQTSQEMFYQEVNSASQFYQKFSFHFPLFSKFLLKSSDLYFEEALKLKNIIQIKSEENEKVKNAFAETEKCFEDELKRTRSDLQEKSDRIFKLNKELEEINNKFKVVVEEKKKLEEIKNGLCTKLDSMHSKKNSLDNDLAQSKQHCQKQKELCTLVEEELQIMKNENAQLKNNIKILEKWKSNFEKVVKEEESNKKIINDLNIKIDLNNKQNIQLENENLIVKAQVKEFKIEKDSLANINKNQIKSINQKQDEYITNLKKQIEELEEYKNNNGKILILKEEEISQLKMKIDNMSENFELEKKNLINVMVEYEKSITSFETLYEENVSNCQKKIEELEQFLKQACDIGTLIELNKLYSSLNNEIVQIGNSLPFRLVIEEIKNESGTKNVSVIDYNNKKNNLNNKIKDAIHFAHNKLDEFIKGKEKIFIFINSLHKEKDNSVIQSGCNLLLRIEDLANLIHQLQELVFNNVIIEKSQSFQIRQNSDNCGQKNKTNSLNENFQELNISSFPSENIIIKELNNYKARKERESKDNTINKNDRIKEILHSGSISIYFNLAKSDKNYYNKLEEFSYANKLLMKQNELQKQKIFLYLIEISEYRKEVKNISDIKEELLSKNENLQRSFNFFVQSSKGNKINGVDISQSKEISEILKRHMINENLIPGFELKKDKNKVIQETEQFNKIIEELTRSNNFYKLTLTNMDSKVSKMYLSYEEKTNNLLKDNQILSKKIKDYEDIQKDLNSPIKIINNLKSIINEKENLLKQNEEKTNEIIDFNKHQKEEIAILGDQIRSLTEKISNLNLEKNRTEKDIQNFHKLIDKHCSEFDECFQQKEIYKHKANILEKKLMIIENSIKNKSLNERNTIFYKKEYSKSPEIEYFDRDKSNRLYCTPQSYKNAFNNSFNNTHFYEIKKMNLSFDSFQPHNIFQSNLNRKHDFLKINISDKKPSSYFGVTNEIENKEENMEPYNIDFKFTKHSNDINLQKRDQRNSIEATIDLEEKIMRRIFKTLHKFNVSLNKNEIENCTIY